MEYRKLSVYGSLDRRFYLRVLTLMECRDGPGYRIRAPVLLLQYAQAVLCLAGCKSWEEQERCAAVLVQQTEA